MLGLEYFGFRELWSPLTLIGTLAVAAVYLRIVGAWRHRFADSEPVPLSRKLLFLAGLAVHYLARGGPVDLLGHMMFSAHMVAMVMAFLMAPPLMLLGLPGWLLKPLFRFKWTGAPLRFFTSPLVSVLMFNAAFSFYHFPAVHDYIMVHYVVHWWFWTFLLFAAFMMWWPIIEPIKEQKRLSQLLKMAYIFANGVLITPACALIIFAKSAMYATYTDPSVWTQAMGYCMPAGSMDLLKQFEGGPAFFAILDPAEDQQLGGVIMKVMQEIIYGAALAYVFFSWYIQSRKDDDIEPLEPRTT
ncbi:cytochrome c oxidase assembly factor CtaG [Paenibacillus thermoaerophilus]|uniref:Cytochrome c oxidase assembly factor CtaG n=1 Tax=Paenibacillus thermoaerophilus TaxID=1215385 RepID=A0ABW2V1X2_9BACL|nr:cytochrome c oxidase assembly factor CtaG [Paenibacillus thermoaerophilus]TMV18224.1 cytochrome c oxidase assembly factor CtaG [Paenibacillus thermoaerophilus]